MKPIIGVTVIALVICSAFVFSEFAVAKKADFGFSMSGNYSFTINNMDGANSVSIEVTVYGQSLYQVINGFGNITAPGVYWKTPSQMVSQFGYGDFQCKVRDNDNSSHVSQSIRFTIP